MKVKARLTTDETVDGRLTEFYHTQPFGAIRIVLLRKFFIETSPRLPIRVIIYGRCIPHSNSAMAKKRIISAHEPRVRAVSHHLYHLGSFNKLYEG